MMNQGLSVIFLALCLGVQVAELLRCAAALRIIWIIGPSSDIQDLISIKKTASREIKMNDKGMTHFGYTRVPEKAKLNLVRSHFNSVASRYDFMNTLLSFGIHILWRRTAVRMLGLEKGDRVLDVCGGTADLTLLMAGIVGGSGRVVLYDINRAMMDIGRAKVRRSSFSSRIRFVQGDAELIAIRDQAFDAATVAFGIRNLTHIEKGFSEMYRVLKPGGKLICLDLSKPTSPLFGLLYDFYSFRIMPLLGELLVGLRQAYTYLPESVKMFPLPEALTEILRGCGFSRVTHKKLTNGIAVVHLAVKPAR